MAIEISGLGHTYLPGTPQAVRALDGIDLAVGDGEFVALIGPTGSGKSTFAQTLNGLLRPSDGRILVDGREITSPEGRKNLKWLRHKVGMVFQFPEHQLFEDTVLADVSFGPRNLGVPTDEARERAAAALRAVGLEPAEIGDRSPFALSGGQMRRVAIAGVLAMEPGVLVLDEPAVGLDPKGREEILGRIRQLHRERGLTVILVSHDMHDVARLAQRLLVMAGGRLVMDGAPAEVFARGDELRALGLDVPVTAKVLEGLRRLGWDVPASAPGVEETAAAIAAAYPAARAAATAAPVDPRSAGGPR